MRDTAPTNASPEHKILVVEQVALVEHDRVGEPDLLLRLVRVVEVHEHVAGAR